MTVTAEEARRIPLDERTPLDWLALLSARLDANRPLVQMYEDYYDGKHPLTFATSKFREAFGNLFSAFADNWCELVVDAPVERLQITGFRMDKKPVDDAWTIWQTNGLDCDSLVAHTESGKCGVCYLLVDPNDGDPRITVEHPSQVVVASDPGDRRHRFAGLKQWEGEDGFLYANVYLPELVVKFQAEVPQGGVGAAGQPDWEETEGSGSNPLKVVPIVPLENKRQLAAGGQSDLKPAIPLQNAVNKLCTDMIVASEYGAFRQRVLTGVEIPRDPETGRPISKVQVEAAMSRLWQFENPEAKVTDLPQTDLTVFRAAIEMLIQHLAAQTRTPPHYLLGQIVNASGDALKASEAALTRKCRAKILFFSDAWEEAMALALGRDDLDQANVEALWADPEQTPVDVLARAANDKKTVGVPEPVLWRELGYTPEQIAEMEQWNTEHREDELLKMQEAMQMRQAQNGEPEAGGRSARPPGSAAQGGKTGSQTPPPRK